MRTEHEDCEFYSSTLNLAAIDEEVDPPAVDLVSCEFANCKGITCPSPHVSDWIRRVADSLHCIFVLCCCRCSQGEVTTDFASLFESLEGDNDYTLPPQPSTM